MRCLFAGTLDAAEVRSALEGVCVLHPMHVHFVVLLCVESGIALGGLALKDSATMNFEAFLLFHMKAKRVRSAPSSQPSTPVGVGKVLFCVCVAVVCLLFDCVVGLL